MGYGWKDALLDVATGGAYSTTKAVFEGVGEVAEARKGESGEAGSVSGAVSAGKEVKYCCYAIEGDYLLNSETGQVWLINKEKRELLPIKRRNNSLESVASAVRLEYLKQFLLEQKDTEIGKLHHSIRNTFSKRIDILLELLDKEIEENMKAGKP